MYDDTALPDLVEVTHWLTDRYLAVRDDPAYAGWLAWDGGRLYEHPTVL